MKRINTLQENVLKSIESFDVFEIIQKRGPISKMDLMQLVDIKKTTLVRVLTKLEEDQIIVVKGEQKNGIGRPSIVYEINRSFGYLVGIHVTRMRMNIVLLNLKYEIVDSQFIYVTSLYTPEYIVQVIQNILSKFMEKYAFNLEQLLGIGVAVATIGAVDKEEGKIFHASPFIGESWNNFNIVDKLYEKFPVNIILDKGVNASVVAEHYFNDYGYQDMMFVVSGGWGIDCGIIKNHELIESKIESGNAYEHMIIDFDGRVCRCGKQGCLIGYTSFESIFSELKRVHPMLSHFDETKLMEATVKDVVDFINTSDDIVKQHVMDSSKYVAYGLSNVINISKPQAVILTGPLMSDFEGYYAKTTDLIKQNVLEKVRFEFNEGKLGENAGAVGSGILALRRTINSDYLRKAMTI